MFLLVLLVRFFLVFVVVFVECIRKMFEIMSSMFGMVLMIVIKVDRVISDFIMISKMFDILFYLVMFDSDLIVEGFSWWFLFFVGIIFCLVGLFLFLILFLFLFRLIMIVFFLKFLNCIFCCLFW